jgi:hypothetical protein
VTELNFMMMKFLKAQKYVLTSLLCFDEILRTCTRMNLYENVYDTHEIINTKVPNQRVTEGEITKIVHYLYSRSWILQLLQ